MFWVRTIISVSLLIIGSLLSDGYKNPLYLYWLIVTAFLLFLIESLFVYIGKCKQKLIESENKVSSLTILKGDNNKVLQISIFPRGNIIAGKLSTIDLYVTSVIPINRPPQIKLLTKTRWDITISSQIQKSERYGDKYEYILVNPLVSFKDEKYLQYSFDIKINDPGQQELLVQLNNGEIKGEVSFLINVYRS